jgi:hypothetical protein
MAQAAAKTGAGPTVMVAIEFVRRVPDCTLRCMSPPRHGEAFLRIHMADIVAVDMFVVATATFRLLWR